MTKQEFLNGKSFSLVGDYSGQTTYKYRNDGARSGGIEREYRMYNDANNILLSDHIMNVEKIGSKKIHLYTFILGKKIVDRIRYEDMIEFVGEKELA